RSLLIFPADFAASVFCFKYSSYVISPRLCLDGRRGRSRERFFAVTAVSSNGFHSAPAATHPSPAGFSRNPGAQLHDAARRIPRRHNIPAARRQCDLRKRCRSSVSPRRRRTPRKRSRGRDWRGPQWWRRLVANRGHRVRKAALQIAAAKLKIGAGLHSMSYDAPRDFGFGLVAHILCLTLTSTGGGFGPHIRLCLCSNSTRPSLPCPTPTPATPMASNSDSSSSRDKARARRPSGSGTRSK